MNNDEITTTAEMTTEKFESNVVFYEPSDSNSSSELEFLEIDFPKLRTIRVSREKIIKFSVNYTKIDEQLKVFVSNNPENL